MSENHKRRVAILFGGQSAEHEISILSARNVLAALDRSRFEPILIGISAEGQWLAQDEERLLASARDPRLVRIEAGPAVPMTELVPTDGRAASASDRRPDVVFPTLHGTLGEDGSIQGLLEVAGIPYVGAGVLGSAIGMDKDVMKRLLREAGIAVTEFRTVRRSSYEADREAVIRSLEPLGLPVFVKPANAGSSVGIRRVIRTDELDSALRLAFDFDSKVLIERAVVGREIELAVLGGDPPAVSVAGEIIVQHPDGFYSYEAKYLDERGARLEAPARLTPEELRTAQEIARQVFSVLECEGMARVDLFLTAQGQFLVNEINTLPGFTAISMYPRLWALSGVGPTELISRLIDLAIERFDRRSKLKRTVP